jgi:DNA-binding transcriptional regulator/RsmH inhibitor MraZ
MIPQFQDYKGSFPYKTDSKNRVNVVPSWRPPQGEGLSLMASVSEGVNIIKVLTNDAVVYRLRKIEQHETDPKKEAQTKTRLKRLLRESSVNEQGKMLIPRDLAQHAGIAPDSEVTLSAGDSHFEIWNREKFESVFGVAAVPEEEDALGIF